MKKIIFFLTLFIPLLLCAQEDNKYLVGAVPMVEGKVVFSSTLSLPGLSRDQVYESALAWCTDRLRQNENAENRIIYTEKESGVIVGQAEEFLVFSANAFALDRALISYRVTLTAQPGSCQLEISRIRYEYNVASKKTPEKYTAEEHISDKVALNKAQTKLVFGTAKFRRKTVDLVEAWQESMQQHFIRTGATVSVKPVTPPVIAVQPPQPVITEPVVEETPVVVPAITPAAVNPVAATGDLSGFRQVTPDKIPGNVIKMISEDWMLITAGDDAAFNMMTASCGGLGQLYGKPVAFCFINPARYTYQLMEKEDIYTLTFYTEAYRDVLQLAGTTSGRDGDKVKTSGLTPVTTPSGGKAFAEAWMVIECRKLIGQSFTLESIFDETVKERHMGQPFHKMYIGEIIGVWIK
ncbi:MAG: DUF4468 domain-containing protein [Bacteroides sp.]|nr:DUF4468 domain-containing protein [Bacteroides sp.]